MQIQLWTNKEKAEKLVRQFSNFKVPSQRKQFVRGASAREEENQ
jgi:hypothetical protein